MKHSYDPNRKDLYIGNVSGSEWGSGSSSANPYKGLMDDFLISSRVLTMADIARLWNEGLASRSADPEIGDLVAKSAGVLYVGVPGASVKTLSGTALQGGVEMKMYSRYSKATLENNQMSWTSYADISATFGIYSLFGNGEVEIVATKLLK